MKLHGSVNWARCTSCKTISPWTLHSFFQKANWDRVYWDDELKQATLDVGAKLSTYHHCGGHACEPDPVIVPPTWNKAEYQEITSVWKHAARHLSEAENIIVIGYSLPEADQFFRYLFALGTIGDARPQRFWIVDPDREDVVGARFRKLLGPSFQNRFLHFQQKFSLAIRDLERAVSGD